MRNKCKAFLLGLSGLSFLVSVNSMRIEACPRQLNEPIVSCIHVEKDAQRIPVDESEILYADTISENSALQVESLLTMDNSKGLLDPEVEAEVRKCFSETYGPLCEMLSDGKMMPVTIEIVPEIGDNATLAYATADNVIVVDAAHLNANVEDIDTITHELAHIAQGYWSIIKVDTWIVEGIADYARYKVGIKNNEAGWDLGLTTENSLYLDGYRSAAGCLVWAEEKYDADLVKKLNQKIKADEYNINLFEQILGKDIDTLWQEYLLDQYGTTVPEVEVSLKPAEEVPADFDIASYLTIVDSKNELNETVKANIKNVFCKQFVAICKEYNNGKVVPVTVRVDSTYNGVAYTNGTEVVVSSNYLNDNPEDYDCITHELVHVAQGYGSEGIPSWVTEGIADYGRYQFGLNNQVAKWGLGYYSGWYGNVLSGYQGTASFLRFVVQNYNEDAVKLLNQYCKEQKYNHFVWKKITGKTFAQLYGDYMDRTPKQLHLDEKMSDAIFEDKDGNPVHLYDYTKKATVIYMGDWQDDGNLLLYLRPAYRIKKIWGDEVNVIYIGVKQTEEAFLSLLDQAGQIYYKDCIFLSDPNTSASENYLTRIDEEGHILMSFPTLIILDENRNIISASCFGTKYETIDDHSEGGFEVQLLQKIYPKAEPKIEWPYNLEGVKPDATVKPSTQPSNAPSQPSTSETTIEHIEIVGDLHDVTIGTKLKLKAISYPNKEKLEDVVWSSSNKEYASVSKSGVVTIKKYGKVKKVIITATTKDGLKLSAKYKIRILKDKVKSLKLSCKKTVRAGKSVKVNAKITTTGSSANKTLIWVSSNNKYATVSSKGVVKAKKAGKGKKVTISAMTTDGTEIKKTVKLRIL